MTKHWTKIEPIFLSAVLALVGWMSLETVSHKTDIAVVKEKVSSIQEDIAMIRKDIHTLVTATIKNEKVDFIVKN